MGRHGRVEKMYRAWWKAVSKSQSATNCRKSRWQHMSPGLYHPGMGKAKNDSNMLIIMANRCGVTQTTIQWPWKGTQYGHDLIVA